MRQNTDKGLPANFFWRALGICSGWSGCPSVQLFAFAASNHCLSRGLSPVSDSRKAMYNRYVPPTKPKAATSQSSPAVPKPQQDVQPASQLQEVGSVPAASYTQYVPARKPKSRELSPASKRKHEESFDVEETPAPQPKKSKVAETAPAGDAQNTANGVPKKTEKQKKRKSTNSEGTLDAPESSDDEQEAPTIGDDEIDAAATTTSTKRKKEKRDKPKKKRDLEENDTEDQPQDGRKASRHASIMAKKDKALQAAPEAGDADAMDIDESEDPEDLEMHGLEPLPQPEPVAIDTSRPTYDTLPSWLSAPIRVAPDTRTPFTELGINAKAAKILEGKGFKDAFAVQTAAVPLLLPSCKHRQGDLLVAAATGSGKTLAYALPIVKDLSQGQVTRLRALIVLPTRELVNQAQEVFQLCANAFDGREAKRVRAGISIGSQQLKQDQASLVEKTERYDPQAYKQAVDRDQKSWALVEDLDSEGEGDRSSKPVAGRLPDHVVDYNSKVDVLICTPGRLVDHINHTPGFSLDFVRWLVVDEADKLLAQSFQGWLDIVMPKLQTSKFSARDFAGSNLSGVRKVILSATLTRDLSLLGGLQLRRPQLIVLEGGQGDDKPQTAEHTLPSLLKEAAVRVYNSSLKPLYLLDLLQGDQLLSPTAASTPAPSQKPEDDTSSEEDSDTSSSGSDSDSDSDSDDTSSSEGSEDAPVKSTKKSFNKTVLIFTKSNEAALRLSRLLALLRPDMSALIGTLTSTQKTSHRRRVLSAFTSGSLRILVASDLVARGIDLPTLDNVINYDLPASAAGYVHRVGRTARAGRPGKAITLVETRESGWFWGAVGKWPGIRRHTDVGRLRIGDKDADNSGFDGDRVKKYQKALEELGREAGEVKKHR